MDLETPGVYTGTRLEAARIATTPAQDQNQALLCRNLLLWCRFLFFSSSGSDRNQKVAYLWAEVVQWVNINEPTENVQ